MMMVCGMVVIGITGHALRLVASGAGVDFFFLRSIEPGAEKKSQGTPLTGSDTREKANHNRSAAEMDELAFSES